MDAEACRRRGLDRQRPQLRAVGVRCADVGHGRPVGVERVRASPGPVHELVADDEVTAEHVRLEAPGGGRRDDPRHAQLFHGPQVGAVVDGGRRQGVPGAMPRQERDLLAVDLPDRDPIARPAVRGLDLEVLDVLQQAVEPGAPENPNPRRHRRLPSLPPPSPGRLGSSPARGEASLAPTGRWCEAPEEPEDITFLPPPLAGGGGAQRRRGRAPRPR